MRDSTVACAPFRSRGDIGQRAELSDTAGVRVDISAAPPAALAGVHRYRHPGPIGTGPGPGWPRVRCWAARRIEIDTGPGTEAPGLSVITRAASTERVGSNPGGPTLRTEAAEPNTEIRLPGA